MAGVEKNRLNLKDQSFADEMEGNRQKVFFSKVCFEGKHFKSLDPSHKSLYNFFFKMIKFLFGYLNVLELVPWWVRNIYISIT